MYLLPPEGARAFKKKSLGTIPTEENKGERRTVSARTIQLQAIPNFPGYLGRGLASRGGALEYNTFLSVLPSEH